MHKVWLYCYIALENNDNRNQGVKYASPKKFITNQKSQWNTSIQAWGVLFKLAYRQGKRAGLQNTEH